MRSRATNDFCSENNENFKGYSRVSKTLAFRTRLVAKPSCENEFRLCGNKKSFSYEWMRTSPRFKTEHRGNSEMAYSAYGKDLILQERTMFKDCHTVALQKPCVL